MRWLILALVLIAACGRPVSENPSNGQACFTSSEKIVKGNSMSPMLHDADTVKFLDGYYDCHEIQKDDLVAYDYAGSDNPLIKKVAAIGGDRLEFNQSRLYVDGVLLRNSVGSEYVFKDNEVKMISLYIMNGSLTKDGFLILGDNVQDSTDSRKFGAIGKQGILGKFEKNS